MSRFSRAAVEDGDDAGIDISPLMDCVFILLIFFIVTTTFVEEKGVQMDKQQAAPPLNVKKTNVVITLNANGEVMCEGQRIGLGGVQTAVRAALQKEADAPVIIQAEATVQSGQLVRIVDEARLAGATRVSGRPR